MKNIYSIILFVFLSLLAIETIGQINLPNGLVAYFKFNGNAGDSSLTAINGVVNNAVLTPGKNAIVNTAYSFNGSNAYIHCDTSNRGITDVVSMSAWVKTTSSKYQWVIGKYDWVTDKGYHLAITNGHPVLAGRNKSGKYISTNYPNPSNLIHDGNWHHIAATISGNTWTIWVDCILDNQVVSTATTPMIYNLKPLTIGHYYSNAEYFDGEIDEVRIYNRALNAAEKLLICDINYIDPVIQAPQVSNDTTICKDSIFTLWATPDTGMVYWESPQGTLLDSGNFYTTSLVQSQDFYVYSKLNGATGDTAEISVTIVNCFSSIDAPLVSNDTTVCKGSIFTMWAIPDTGMIYWAYNGVVLDSGNVLDTAISQSMNFDVYSILNGVYSDTSVIKIRIVNCISSISAPVVSNDTTVCEDSLLTLWAIPDTGKIYWATSSGILLDSGSIFTFTVTQSQVIYVYSVLNGISSDTAIINVISIDCTPVIGAPIVSNDTVVCMDTLFSLWAIPDKGTIVWESPLGTNVGNGILYTGTTSQDQTFYVYSVLNGLFSDTATIIVSTMDCTPMIPMPVMSDTAVCMDEYITFYISSDSGIVYWESPLGYIIGAGDSISYLVEETADIYVYRVFNTSYSDTVSFEVEANYCEEIVFPNVFTPNGDGVNDYFTINLPDATCFNCRIYNRWGVLIEELTESVFGWDGVLSASGIEAPAGVYFYEMTYCLENGEVVTNRSSLTLMR